MSYSVEFSREAAGHMDAPYRSDRKFFHRIINKMEFLKENPCEGRPLVENHRGGFSLRVGNYRVGYEIDSSDHILYVLTVKHQRHVYR